MFTIETKQMDIIINKVNNKRAKDSLYHMLINYERYINQQWKYLMKIWKN